MKIYVASSWRNAHQPKVVEVLRSAGHEVYDFKNPAPGNEGFSWRQVGEDGYKHGDVVSAERWRRMVDHPVALEGHAHDLGAMKWADACVYVLPCGRSASFEAGWFAGQGRRLVVLAFEPTEPELMFREADIVGSLAGMLDALASPSPETGGVPTCLKFQPHPGGERCHVCGGVSGDHPDTPAPEPVKPPVTLIVQVGVGHGQWQAVRDPRLHDDGTLSFDVDGIRSWVTVGNWRSNGPIPPAIDDGHRVALRCGKCGVISHGDDCHKCGARTPAAEPGKPATCTKCGGTGEDRRERSSEFDYPCGACNGTGRDTPEKGGRP